MKKLCLICSFILFFSASTVIAQTLGLDENFNANCGSGTNGPVYSFDIQNDGKIVIAGNFSNFNAFANSNLDRILPSGGIDGTFIVGTGFDSWISKVKVMSNGNIFACGDFYSIQGTSYSYFGSLNPNGTSNSSFLSNSTDAHVKDFTELPNGKIMVGGQFQILNGFNRPYFGILYPDGNLDAGTNVGTGPNGFVNGIVKTSDRAYLFGYFTSYNGNAVSTLARVYHDGTYDPSFNTGSSANLDINCLAVQNDGKILVGGNFTSFNGQNSNKLIRLNNDGSIDATFTIGSGFNDEVKSIAIQPDGKILVAGNFNAYNGVSRNRILRLLPNGTLDASFDPGTGFNSVVHEIKINAEGNIIAVGEFSEYNSVIVGHIAKLNSSALLVHENTEDRNVFYPNPADHSVNLKTNEPLEFVQFYNLFGQMVYRGNSKTIDLGEFENGMYIIEMKCGNELKFEKLEIQH